MANYSIFVLGEGQLSVSVAQGLDGINQGTGIHLIGETITINSRAATEVFITDAGSDTDFSDNDGNQRLNGDQTIDGTLFSSGTRVEAEYGITLTDGTTTWQAVAFNVNNSSPAYGTVEGIAFIGGPGQFPPAGVPLTVVSTQEGPSFASNAYVSPICYCRGTLIETKFGYRPIEMLKPGDEIWTRDNGYLPVIWTGEQAVITAGRFRMVEIPEGTLSNFAPLKVSQQHRMLVTHPLAEILCAENEVFVPAISLVDAGIATMCKENSATYHHLLLETHNAINANGASSESLLLAPSASRQNPDDLFFHGLVDQISSAVETARLTLKRKEATFLINSILTVDPNSRLIHTPPQTERGIRPVRAGKNEARV